MAALWSPKPPPPGHIIEPRNQTLPHIYSAGWSPSTPRPEASPAKSSLHSPASSPRKARRHEGQAGRQHRSLVDSNSFWRARRDRRPDLALSLVPRHLYPAGRAPHRPRQRDRERRQPRHRRRPCQNSPSPRSASEDELLIKRFLRKSPRHGPVLLQESRPPRHRGGLTTSSQRSEAAIFPMKSSTS